MATQTFPINAETARQMVSQYVRSQNHGRRIPEMPKMLESFSKENTVHIYSVGPWSHTRDLGSAGSFRVPACEADKEYAGPLSIPGIVNELIPVDGQFELRQEPGGGEYLAQQVIGVGPHLPPSNSFARYGIFIGKVRGFPTGKAPIPSKLELAAANADLAEYFMELVLSARSASAKGQKEKESEIRSGLHDVAARALASEKFGFQLNLDNEDWIVNTTPTRREKCVACGTMNESSVVLCANCKFILKSKEYEALKGGFAK
jgi:hypothetical protein